MAASKQARRKKGDAKPNEARDDKKQMHMKVKLPARANKNAYDDQASLKKRRFVAERF